MKRSLLVILVIVISLSAAFVPADRAKTVAENYYKHIAPAEKGAVSSVYENKFQGEITWYSFDFGKGFVIVAADDAVRPVLGYSDHGKSPVLEKKGGENFKEWFSFYDKQIILMRKNNLVNQADAKKWKDIENNVFSTSKGNVVVDRLVQTKWDQVWPWNDLCPKVDNNPDSTTYVGCVATAMAQILNYHRWPDVGVGSGSGVCGGTTVSATFSNHTWNWSKMVNEVEFNYGLYPQYWETSNVDSTQVYEMALLSFYAGASAGMDWATAGSGAYSFNVDNAFLDHWKASSSVYKAYTTAALAVADSVTTRAELDAKRPWYWSGGVHAFVLDGYTRDNWYHFNWGWAGTADGWYQLTDLTPDELGSGSGTLGDYTTNQNRVSYVPSTNPYTAWPVTALSGSISGADDVILTWTAKTGATGYKVYRTKDHDGFPELLTTVTALTYTDADLTSGGYSYYVTVTYATGESHVSNSYNAAITVVAGYPVPRALSVAAVGRTSIDLAWMAPFVGVLNQYVDYEPSGAVPSTWLRKISWTTGSNTVKVWKDTSIHIVTAHEDSYTGWHDYPELQGQGWFMLVKSTASGSDSTKWFLSPPITFNSAHTIKWWNRFRYTDDNHVPVANRPLFQVVSYAGTFSEVRNESNISYTTHATYDGSNGSPENIWASENSVSLASLAGTTTRVGFRVPMDTTDLYTLGFDNITIGSTTGGGDNPTGYEVFRNGALAGTVSSGTTYSYSDTGFADGNNSYYVKALFPTGKSISTAPVTAFINANPKPDYLTGTGGTQANLSWYIPYHNSPKWYAHLDPTEGFSTTELDGIVLQRKRMIFKAADCGFYYPITLDSIAAVFYDLNEGNWGGVNQFKFRILKGGTTATDTIAYESGVLTATHNTLVKHKLATPLVLNQPFNVEVYNNTASSYPANLSGKAAGSAGHSYFQYDPGTGLVYTYGITFGSGGWAEWAFQAHVTSSAPAPIAKEGWMASAVSIPDETNGIKVDIPAKIPAPYSGKAMDHYNVYRNNTPIGTSTNTTYADNSVTVTGDYTYKVTAAYVTPSGESAPSNEIVLNVTASGPIIPAVPANVTTSLVSGNVYINWDNSADATSYDVYASATPYGTYTLLTNVSTSEYTYTSVASNAKMFFYIVSKNGTKTSPKKILILDKASEK